MSDTLFLKFIAIILITNSHLDSLYQMKWIGTGGTLGNALFFMMSGLGLFISAVNKPIPSFKDWIFRRLSRIYPSLWIVEALHILTSQSWPYWQPLAYVFYLLYPTPYWFLSALLLFYLLIFPLLKSRYAHLPLIGMGLLLIPYFYFYFNALDLSRFSVESAGLFKWIFYLQVLLFGAYLAPIYLRWKKSPIQPSRKDGFYFVLSVLFYVALKIVIAAGFFTVFQFLTQWAMFPFVYYALKLAQHPWVAHAVDQPFFGMLIRLMGTATLEMYLLQHELYTAPWIRSLVFPFNVLIFWLLLLPLSYGIYRLADYLRGRVCGEQS